MILNGLKNKPQALRAPYTAFWWFFISREFLFHVISVITKGAIVSSHAPSKVFRRTRESAVPTWTPNRPKMYLFCPWKSAEVPDVNALKLCKNWGFRKFHLKSMFLGHNRYICGRFVGHVDTINTSIQSGVLKMRLNVSTMVPTAVTAFCSGGWINGF